MDTAQGSGPSLDEFLKGIDIAASHRTQACFLVVNGEEITGWTKFGYSVEANDNDPSLENTFAELWYATAEDAGNIVRPGQDASFILRAGTIAVQGKTRLLLHNTIFFVGEDDKGHMLGGIQSCQINVKRGSGLVFNIDVGYRTVAIPINKHAEFLRTYFAAEIPNIIVGQLEKVEGEGCEQ